MDMPAVYLEQELAFEDVPPFVLLVMYVERRSSQRWGDTLHNRESIAGVMAGDLYAYLVSYNVQSFFDPVISRLEDER